MLEERRTCAGCGRVVAWGEKSIFCSDQRTICPNCLTRANLPIPSAPDQHIWPSDAFVERVRAHDKYDEFCNKAGTQKLLNGCLLINENDKTFAVGSNDYDEMLIGFQAGSYETVDSISINDGVQTKSIKVSDGDTGAAGALFGGLVFGPLGALVGGLGTRTDAQYGEIIQTNNIGFTITHNNTSHDNFNVLKLCLNYDFVNYESQREIYEEAKELTVKICGEILKRVEDLRPTRVPQTQTSAVGTMGSGGSVNINPNNVEPTITRIELFLEDGEWDSAKLYANAALDYFPTDYRLYLYLLLGELKASSIENLKTCDVPFTEYGSYKKLKRFADPDLVRELESYAADALERRGEIQKAQKDAERQKEIEEQQLKAQEEERKRKAFEDAILGVYGGTNFITPSWTAYKDHITYKNKDFYFKDMQEIKITKIPDSSLSAGQIMIYMKNKKMQFIAFKYIDCERAVAFIQYVKNKMLLAPLEEAREKLAQESVDATENQAPVDEVWE